MELNRLTISVNTIWSSLALCAANLIGYLCGPAIRDVSLGDLKVVPLNRKYYPEVLSLWRSRETLFLTHKILLRFFGKKLCLVLIDPNGSVAGFFMFYYRVNEIMQRKIHVAFFSIRPDGNHKGLGSALATTAFNMFNHSWWIKGVSARYDVNNVASRRIFMKYGFRVERAYRDEVTGVDREYVIYDYIHT